MNVSISCAREVEVDNVINRRDIETSCSDICCDKDAVFGRLEAVQILQTLLLLQLRVEREHGDLENLEERDQAADAVDTSHEDKRSARVAKQEVVQVEILFKSACSGCRKSPCPS